MGQNTGLEQSYNYGMKIKIAPAIQMVPKTWLQKLAGSPKLARYFQPLFKRPSFL
jgi:hypothetical protein